MLHHLTNDGAVFPDDDLQNPLVSAVDVGRRSCVFRPSTLIGWTPSSLIVALCALTDYGAALAFRLANSIRQISSVSPTAFRKVVGPEVCVEKVWFRRVVPWARTMPVRRMRSPEGLPKTFRQLRPALILWVAPSLARLLLAFRTRFPPTPRASLALVVPLPDHGGISREVCLLRDQTWFQALVPDAFWNLFDARAKIAA